jgi:hypothetical protein
MFDYQVKGTLLSLKGITDMFYQHILASHLYDRHTGHDVSNVWEKLGTFPNGDSLSVFYNRRE